MRTQVAGVEEASKIRRSMEENYCKRESETKANLKTGLIPKVGELGKEFSGRARAVWQFSFLCLSFLQLI